MIAENYGFDPRFRMSDVRSSLEATVPLLSTNAHMNLDRVARLADWMYEKGILKRKPPVRRAVHQRLLGALSAALLTEMRG